uniref:Transposase (Putative), gypsy type n=1 Tax=Tanacetum cinerariifolium TaxID=118510 RepID=A0A6L2LLP4_TANCI|nr:transposase (putative), gypsy type [Tanacetum cinerariifolium]
MVLSETVLSPYSGHGQLANRRYPRYGGCHLVRGRRRIPPNAIPGPWTLSKLEQPFFWVDERVFPTVVDWRTSALKDRMPTESTYSVEALRALDTHRTPIQKQPKMLLCLVGISRRYYLGDEVYPTFFHDDDQDMDLFNLIRAPNPTKVKIGSRPRAAHEVPLLTMSINRVIEMEDSTAATDSSEVPPPEDVPATSAPEAGQAEKVATTDPSAITESHKRSHDGADANAPPKVLRRDHADPRPTGSTHGGKSLAAIELGMASTHHIHVPESAPAGVSDPDPLSFADPRSRHPADVAQSPQCTTAAGDPESENASFAFAVGSPESIYRPEWAVANGSLLDTPEACQDLVDHVAMGSQLRLRFEQEAKLLRKSVAQVAHRDKRIQAREHKIKNLEALLKAEADIKKATEDQNVRLSQELEDMRALFSDLQVSNNRLSHRVEQHCAKMDARLDALSIDFDEELYPHMLTAIAGRRWMIGHEFPLAVMKCGESLELRQAFTNVVSAGIAKGMSNGFRHRVEHGRAEKKKKCRIVCRTHGVGSVHHARSDGISVSVPTVIPQGLAILLADAATQTNTD